MKYSKNNIANDFLWYMIGTAIPMLVLFIRSPIYTRIFSPEQFGVYSLIYITFTYFSAISFQGITNGAWRYFFKYQKSNKLRLYKSVISYLYIIITTIILIPCTIWYLLAEDPHVKQLVFYGFIYITTNELFNTLFVPARLKGKAIYYNTLNGLRSIFSFGILLALTFWFSFKIEAFFIAPIVSNIVFISPLIKQINFVTKTNSELKKHLFRFIRYGSANLVYNLGMFLLISSDRYIIAIFEDSAKVGIYNQTYNIGQISIAAIISVINSSINHIVLSELQKRPKSSNTFLLKVFSLVFYIALPITLLFTIFSKDIVFLLLGPEFREAWRILPLILLGSLLNGMCYFAIVKIKFNNNFRLLLTSSMIAAAINVILNMVFVKLWGYQAAAITTLIAYIILFIILYNQANINLITWGNLKEFSSLLVSSILIIMTEITLKYVLKLEMAVYMSILKLLLYSSMIIGINFRKFRKLLKLVV